MTEWRVGDPVVIKRAPADIEACEEEERRPAAALLVGKEGTVQGVTSHGITVHLDHDVSGMDDYGWVTNDFTFEVEGVDDRLQTVTPSTEEVEGVLSSIQMAVQNRAARRATR